MTPSIMAGLVEAVPRVFGTKLAKGSISEAQRYLSAVGKEFCIFALADNLFPGMLVGSRTPPLAERALTG